MRLVTKRKEKHWKQFFWENYKGEWEREFSLQYNLLKIEFQ